MCGAALEASRRLRRGVVGFGFAVAAVAFLNAPALARTAKTAARSIDNPRYASIVVDATTNVTLREANADGLRHPASLTKIMTLYLLFERLESGKLKLNSPLPISEDAASQSPTKLGLKPGQYILVEDAIKALVTKSANDIAVAIAEAIAGSEDEFAVLMTRKARALGMSRTVYRNASGLPDDSQVTTARDQARLGVLIQERFPRFYRYFSTVNFAYRGDVMRNHNHLLGRIAGVDGIKTGYTHASGYNLITSVRRGGRHIVAVVMGGDTAGQRDAHMRDLIERYIVEAAVKRPDVNVAQAQTPKPEAKPQIGEAVQARAETRSEQRTEANPAQAPMLPRLPPRIVIVPIIPTPSEGAAPIVPPPALAGSTEQLPSNAVKTVPIRAAALPLPMPQLNAYAPAPEIGSGAALESPPLRGPSENRASEDEPVSTGVTGNIGAPSSEPRRPGWSVQVGAFDEEDAARQRLQFVRGKAAELLTGADPYTERTTKGEKTLYRARFSGLDRGKADAICKILHRSDVACIAIKN